VLKLIFAQAMLLFLVLHPVFAADLSFSLKLTSKDRNVTITVENISQSEAILKSVQLKLDNHDYELSLEPQKLAPHSEKKFDFIVASPSVPGTYPLIATLKYFNDNKLLSLCHVGAFHFQESAVLPETCITEEAILSPAGNITIRSLTPSLWRLVLPEEIKVVSDKINPDRRTFKVESKVTEFNNFYPYYAIAEDEKDGKHRTAIARGSIKVQAGSSRQSSKGKIPSTYLLLITILSVVTCFISANKTEYQSHLITALAKYSSRIFLIAGSYLLIRNADNLINFALNHVDLLPINYLARLLIDHFRGSNYQYFFNYFIDIYLIGCLLLLLPYIYYFDNDKLVYEDKYSSLMISIFSLGAIFRFKKPYWNYRSKLGLLTLCVKLFFVPFLVTWVINNTFHQVNISKSFHWDLATVNAFLVALFIYIDTTVFCFGYLFEFECLKNEIKSVEPTILGWIVCLWCYPPFNVFSYKIFDYPLANIQHQYPSWVIAGMTCMITILWGIFAWASLALGWKASNLTNRGIVTKGPYKFVRHPAYASKLMAFYILGIFMGQYYLGLLFGFTLIYVLRAWTEERHLSNDPDYAEYKKQVKWRFIPNII
jgi:protein-S-isoprenylcysteine O-methyltransferase Ste14